MSDLVAAKRAARVAARAARAQAHARGSGAAAQAVRDRVLALIPAGPTVVSAYWPMADELDVRPLLAALEGAGHAIGLPVTAARAAPLVFRRWRMGDALCDGGFGTAVPAACCAVVVPAVLIVPLLAFDRAGFRLGYGGGYYDRTLAALRAAGPVAAIGVAYAAQEIASVPHDGLDQRLDAVVTERETIFPAGGPAGGNAA